MKRRKRSIVVHQGWDFNSMPPEPIFTVVELCNVLPDDDMLFLGALLDACDLEHYFEQGLDFTIKHVEGIENIAPDGDDEEE